MNWLQTLVRTIVGHRALAIGLAAIAMIAVAGFLWLRTDAPTEVPLDTAQADQATGASTADSGTAAPSIVPTGDRIALVIGNGSYDHGRDLDNSKNDAAAIAQALKDVGFSLLGDKAHTDLDYHQMINLVHRFSDEAKGKAAAVIFYSGHGVEDGGRNYLIPTDATLGTVVELDTQAVALRTISASVANAGIGIVILDACRTSDFPLADRLGVKRGGNKGLGKETGFDRTLIAYAAEEKQAAADGAKGEGSPYTRAILNHIAQGGLDVRFLFGAVREDVIKATTDPSGVEDPQRPMVADMLGTVRFMFVPGEPPIPVVERSGGQYRLAKMMGISEDTTYSELRQRLGQERAQSKAGEAFCAYWGEHENPSFEYHDFASDGISACFVGAQRTIAHIVVGLEYAVSPDRSGYAKVDGRYKLSTEGIWARSDPITKAVTHLAGTKLTEMEGRFGAPTRQNWETDTEEGESSILYSDGKLGAVLSDGGGGQDPLEPDLAALLHGLRLAFGTNAEKNWLVPQIDIDALSKHTKLMEILSSRFFIFGGNRITIDKFEATFRGKCKSREFSDDPRCQTESQFLFEKTTMFGWQEECMGGWLVPPGEYSFFGTIYCFSDDGKLSGALIRNPVPGVRRKAYDARDVDKKESRLNSPLTLEDFAEFFAKNGMIGIVPPLPWDRLKEIGEDLVEGQMEYRDFESDSSRTTYVGRTLEFRAPGLVVKFIYWDTANPNFPDIEVRGE